MKDVQPKSPPSAPRLPVLSDDTVRQMLANQAQEATLRSQELAIRQKELDHQSRHASDILGAQERDRDKERQHQRMVDRNKMIFLGAVLALLIGFACYGLQMNKDGLVRDILQTVLGAVVGAVGGYGYATAHKPKARPGDTEDT